MGGSPCWRSCPQDLPPRGGATLLFLLLLFFFSPFSPFPPLPAPSPECCPGEVEPAAAAAMPVSERRTCWGMDLFFNSAFSRLPRLPRGRRCLPSLVLGGQELIFRQDLGRISPQPAVLIPGVELLFTQLVSAHAEPGFSHVQGWILSKKGKKEVAPEPLSPVLGEFVVRKACLAR